MTVALLVWSGVVWCVVLCKCGVVAGLVYLGVDREGRLGQEDLGPLAEVGPHGLFHFRRHRLD